MANDARLVGSVVPEVSAYSVSSSRSRQRRRRTHMLFAPAEHVTSHFLNLCCFAVLAVARRHRGVSRRPYSSRVRASAAPSLPPHLTLPLRFFVEVFDFDPKAPNSPHFISPSVEYPAEFRISACELARPLSFVVVSHIAQLHIR